MEACQALIMVYLGKDRRAPRSRGLRPLRRASSPSERQVHIHKPQDALLSRPTCSRNMHMVRRCSILGRKAFPWYRVCVHAKRPSAYVYQ